MNIRRDGFTLIELAVALFVLMLLLSSIVVPLTTRVEQRKISDTRRALDEARDALIGFASANGYLPCPADSASNGAEASGTNHVTGVCPASVTGNNVYVGFLPAATLGLTATDSQGYALDGWGLAQNRIRYAVSNQTVNSITNPLTRTSGMSSVGLSSLAAAQFLYVCNSGTGVTVSANCGTAVTLASNAMAVLYSVGPNAATGGTGADEAENPNPNGGSADRIFVSRDWGGGTGAEFDDIVTWIGTSPLFNRMIAAGQLP